MQVDKDVRRHQLRLHDLEEPLVEFVFLFGKIDPGKKQAFGKEIIGDGQRLEEIPGVDKLLQLLIAFGHKEQLQREGVLRRVLIEFGEEGVVGKLLEDKPGVVMPGQQMRQCRFTRSNIAFYRYKVVLHVRCCLSLVRVELFHRQWVGAGEQQFPYRYPENRMDIRWCDLFQRRQGKTAVLDLGMGDQQSGLPDDRII